MAKSTNHTPDARTDENDAPIQYPEGSVVGIVDTVDQLGSAIDALRSNALAAWP